MKKILFLVTIFLFHNSLYALSIQLDGSINRISGTKCGIATYRLGTTSSYNGQQIDLLLKVLKEDNDYRGGSCVDTQDNVLSFHLKDNDSFDNRAYMDIEVMAVEKNTTLPVVIDRFLITNFDLDRSNNLLNTNTDDVYYRHPSQLYLSNKTNIVESSGDFYGQYSSKLKGQDSGDCDDSATLTTLECRAGVSFENSSSFYARVENTNAYGELLGDSTHRLIQFSFEEKDIAPLLNEETPPLLGEFNIERTDSGNFAIGTEARNAWYTQIVGRDFDYSVLFYNKNMTKEKNINQLSLKIELINQDSNKTLYERYAYIQDATKRVDVLLPKDDLSSLPATKRAIFRVSYGVDSNNSIVQKACESDPKFCYERDTAVKKKYDYAKDNFAIRPAHFSISISDKIKLASNSGIAPRALRAAAGYEYNLTAIASQYGADSVASRGYDGRVEQLLHFVGDRVNCTDIKDYKATDAFRDGAFQSSTFTHTNVGAYLLRLSDTTWTAVDANNRVANCIVGESGISADGNSLSGCNIASIADINLSFYPYQFKVNFNVHNLPDSGHDDFLYMSPISSTDNIAMQFVGSITAETQKAQQTSNFTDGCVASSVILQVNTTITTDEGVDKGVIHTTPNELGVKEEIHLSRMVKLNNETARFDEVPTINTPVEIDKSKFVKNQQGSVDLELRYNIKKHLFLTINPVEMLFNSLDANSAPAYSLAEDKQTKEDPYVPRGTQDLNLTRNFYFTRVASDMQNYPKVNFHENREVRTPLNVDIFCNAGIQYCTDRGVRGHTDLTGLSQLSDGWYISTDHNNTTDGQVQKLDPNRVVVIVSPVNDINLTNGRYSLITNRFNSCNSSNETVMVSITPDEALLYDKNPANSGHPYYTISCRDQNRSEISGIGQTGNIIGSKANSAKELKMDW